MIYSERNACGSQRDAICIIYKWVATLATSKPLKSSCGWECHSTRKKRMLGLVGILQSLESSLFGSNQRWAHRPIHRVFNVIVIVKNYKYATCSPQRIHLNKWIAYINSFIKTSTRTCKKKNQTRIDLWAIYAIGVRMYTSCTCVLAKKTSE